MASRYATGVGHLGWTAVYVGLVVTGASPILADGVPTQGCYPECVGTVEPTLTIAGLAALLAGIGLAGVGRVFAGRERSHR